MSTLTFEFTTLGEKDVLQSPVFVFFFSNREIPQEEKDLKTVFQGNSIQSSLVCLGSLPVPTTDTKINTSSSPLYKMVWCLHITYMDLPPHTLAHL